MPQPALRRIRDRDFYGLGFGVLLTLFTYGPSDYLPPGLQPCPNSAWQDIVSFFIALSCGVALIEGLNWLLTRKITRPAYLKATQTELEPFPNDLLIPRGWTGLTLGLVLLIVPYVMHSPEQCKLWQLGRISSRYVAGTLFLAYGLVLVGQVVLDINAKVSQQKGQSP
jgi:hypothetical protein